MEEHSSTVAVLRDDGARSAVSLRLRAPASAALEGSKNLLKIGMRENNSSTSEHPSSGAPMASAPHPHRSNSFVHRLLLPVLLLTSLVHSPDLGIAASAVPSDAAEVPAGPGGGFEIEWAQAPVPARLHRAEILLNSGLDAQGKRMALGVPASLAHGDGRLFLASNSEPSVFGRDPAGGGLAFERVSAGVSDDHGDDLSTATPVAIPSNTDGEITRGGDRDYFRIDVAEAGIVSFETTGNTDTFGTLYDSDGTVIGQDDESGPGPNNFRLADVVLFERTYFLEVRGYSSRTEGEYRMRVSGDARGTMTPVATAPSVSIDAIPSGNEGTTVRLGATLSGGAYDGAVEYAWTVDGGVLDSASSATTTWTRPSVSSNTNHTVGLTVTVRGTGTNAESGTSDTASASRDAFVSSVAPALPVADAPAVSINPIPAGNEGTTVRLGAALTGGTYDRGVEYAWTVDDGTLDNAGSATPTWTRPSVDSNTNHTVRLTITVRGSGANARNGTSDTASTSRTALVRNVAVALPAADAPSVSINAIADGDEATTVQLGANVTGGTYDGAVEYDWSVNGGTLNDATLATPTWTRPTVSANTNYTVNLTVTVDGTGTAARNGTSDTASASASATVRDMPRLTITTLASNLTIPWDLDFTPDGTMLFTERAGKLSARLTDGTVQAVTAALGDVYAVGESGLMAIVVDPDFTTNRRFYTCQAHTGPEVQVIAWTINSGYTAATRAADPLVGGIPAKANSGRHSGCRLRFGPDGHLWVATGDAATGSTPQDKNSLGGKVLRVNPSTGAGVAGNPFAAAPQIYSFGHRNIQGLALRPGTRQMWVVEHGPTTDDEINLLASGGNYGWDPTRPGSTYYEGVPMTDLTKFPGAVPAKWSSGRPTLATSGGVFLEGDGWRGWEGRLAVASLKDRSLRLFEFSAGGDLVSEVHVSSLSNSYGRLRTPMLGPDGALYLTTSNGSAADRILRVEAGDGTSVQRAAAAAPSVSIDAIADGDENTTVQFGAALTSGIYDGAVEYDWSVSGGILDDHTAAAPTWTRPAVSSDTSHTVNLTVTVNGTGAKAVNGTSDTANATASKLVRDTGGTGDDHGNDRASATTLAIPSTTAGTLDAGDEDFFRIDIGRTGSLTLESTGSTDTYGILYDSDGAELARDDDGGTGQNFRISRDSLQPGTYYLLSRAFDPAVSGDYSLTVSGSAQPPTGDAFQSESASAEEANSTADDHGNDPASATPLAIPSTTAGEIGAGDKDYFRIDVVVAGFLTFETTGSTDTYGTLYDSDGAVIDEDNDLGPRPNNFRITDALVLEGSYFLEVRGASPSRDTGPYELRMTGDARGPGTPAATAPSVSIHAIPSGNEGTDVRLGATLTSGAYDGAVEYAWSVDGGTLDSSSSATPIWTRPAVNSNTNHTVRLTVTVRGTGTNAESGTSDSASANRQALVRDVPLPLPAADAPAVTINTIPSGNENTTVRLGATLSGGTYDGTPEFAWTVTGGRLSNPNSATPTWTRPTLNADADYTVRLTVTVRGRGTNARSGTSERVNANRTARVLDVPVQLPAAAAPSVSINAIPAGNEGTAVQLGATLNGGTYDGALDYAWTVTGGTLDNANRATPTWTRPSVVSNTNYTVRLTITARGTGTAARIGSSDTANTSRTALVRNVVALRPVAAAPSVSIDAIPAGDENANVQLAATLNGGTYDGAVDYAWTVTGGTLDDPAAATPTWTRPSVTSNTNFTVRLTVTARGAGTVARNGTSDTANATFSALVRNVVVVLPVAAAPSVTINAIPAGDENTNVQLAATLNGGTYDGAVEYAWSVNGGALNSSSSATPTWARPSVTSNTNHTASLTVTVRGSGTVARNGTSDTANTTRTAQVRDTGGTTGDHGNDRASATTVGIPSTTTGTITAGDRDYFRIDVSQAGSLRLRTTGNTDTYGTLFDSGGSKITEDDDSGPPRRNFLIVQGSVDVGTHYLEVRGWGRRTAGDYTLEVTGTARSTGTQLPAASAPSVTINAVPAGDEGTAVQLGATLAGGTYDGAVDYTWSVSGGTLDNANLATPTWTRPSVNADANHTVSLTVSVDGSGTNASNGTSDTASTSRTAQVRNVVVLPVAAAPTVSIDTIPAGNENTTVQLAATLNGGTYDGAVDYAWTVTGGTLDDPAAATPTWTRPSVASNTNFTVRLTVTARGDGSVARNGSSDTANTTFSALVRNVVVLLPMAAAPSATINAIPAGNENTNVQLAATLNGGTYDGSVEYAWSVNGGTLDSASSATPTWARPSVTSNTNHTVSLTITVRGSGTVARNSTSDTASTTRTAQVRNVGGTGGDHGNNRASATTVGIPSTTAGKITVGDRDYFRIDVSQAGSLRLQTSGTTDTWGTLFDSGGSKIREDDDAGPGRNFRIFQGSVDVGTYYVEVRGWSLRSTTGDYSLEVSGDARSTGTQLPAASAPSVSINNVPAGDEGTAVQLGATLAGGTYDGAVDYTWSVSGGTLDNANLATPTWTRPSVNADANHTVSLTVSVDGSGTNASNGTSDTASTSRTAQVRDVPLQLPPAAAPSVSINTIPAGNEGTDVQLSAALGSGTHDGAVEYQWSVDGGVLDNANAATPTWTRPSVTSNTNRTVSLTITVRGTGTTARNGTSDTANTSRSAQVRNVVVLLPTASAPTVTINAVPAGNENTAVQLGATLSGGGTYDGAVEYDWSVNGGVLNDSTLATPTWTRPSVSSDSSRTVSLTVTVRGTGTAASNGTSDTASTSLTAQVRDAGDHGNDQASATRVAIPSTTAGTLTSRDRDYFRIEVGQAGSLRLETTSGLDTYGTLLRGDGSQVARNDDSGSNRNFRISMGSIGAGVYYLQVRGFHHTTTGPYNLEVSGTARGPGGLPAASAPTVSIDSIPAGDEDTAVQLAAALVGGTYDGAVDYTWSVSGGVLDNANLAAPTWTRPTVNADTNHTISLTVSVDGSGTNASSGTSDTASTSRSAQVRNVVLLPVAAAPTVSIDAIPAGNENTNVQLGATLNGGTYDGTVDYAWTATGGTLNDPAAATPTWTRPSVASNTNYTVRLTVTARGSGTVARNGTSNTANATRTTQVRNVVVLPVAAAPSVTINAIPAGNEGTAVQLGATLTGGGPYDGAVEYDWSVNGGTLDNANSATPNWTRPSVASDTNRTVSLTITVRGTGATARSGTSDTANATRTTQVRNVVVLSAAAAPSVTINAIPTGNEGTAVQLGAALTGGGPYDGAVEYDWSVNGGTLDNANSATPNWTRPSVASDTNRTVSLTITVRGTGTTARNGTSDTASTSRDALVRNDTGTLPAATAPAVSINAIADGDEATSVQLGAALTGGDYDGTPEYAWSVTRGTLANPNSATPTWTRPKVASDTNHTVRLTVTVRGDGTAALDGTSDSQSASRSTQVRDTGGTGDDHGNNRADASPVSIPSTTTANLGRGDRDYYRINVAHAGSLRLQTRGRVDTVGTLQRSNGAAIASNDDGGQAQNFHIFRNSVDVGVYYLEVRGYSNSSASRGDYTLEVTGTARGADSLPSAAAPSVTINAIADGDEGATVQLGAVLTGGTYDGAVDYAWSVDGGTLDDSTLATPTWTRPVVTSDANYTASLIVTVQGSGTNAASGTSATANASRTALVRNVTTALPVAAAPAVTINAIAAGDEGSTVQLGAALSGGTYDGAVDYAWTATGGTLANADTATPTWTRPAVNANTNYTLRLTVTARGAGTNARNGTSATANASRTAQVRNLVQLPVAAAPSVTIDAIPVGDEGVEVQLGANVTGGTYDGAVEYDWRVNGGSLNDATLATPTWTRPAVSANTNYTVNLTVTVRGTGTVARNGSSDTASASASARVRDKPRLTVTTLASNLNIPWDLDFTPDGTMLFTERAGKLSARLTDGTVQAVTAALGDVYAVGESGLMAIVVDPDFTTNRRFYTCQAHTGPEVQVIAWTINSGYTAATRATDPLVGGIPAKANSGRHSGCRLRFGPDGHLWIATGDAATGSTPQDKNSLGGKVLRVNPSTGAGVAGNPFAAAPQIYSFGHRNIQGLALRPGTRQMWVVEHGPTTDDEINLLASGGNYGWDPTRPGSTYYEGVPMTDLTKFPGAVPAKWSSGRPTLATSGGVFLEGDGWRGWEGRLAVASLKDRSLRLFEFSAGGDLVSEVHVSSLSNSYGRLRTPMLGPDGALYLTTSNGSAADRILRVEAGDGTSVQRAAAAAPSVSIDAIADGDENTTVQFSAALTSGIYDGAVEYDWSVSGGILDDHTAAAPTWTRPVVSSDTTYTVSLTVTVNGAGANAVNGTSDTVTATTSTLVRALPVAAAPSVSINSIADGNEGTTVQLGAAVTGGTYDGAVEYDWSVNGGTLDDDSIASPTWTRPTVNANANYTASLTVTVRGSGTNARNGSSATATATRSALVQNVASVLPSAVAPTVSINAIPAGDEGTDVQLSATVAGGTYDTAVEYRWRVDAGLLDNATSATPTWTRPSVASNTNHNVQLEVSVEGSGTNARNGTSATASSSRLPLVRNTGPDDHGDDIASATTVQLPSTTSARLDPGDKDYFRINIVRAGTLRLWTTGSVDTFGTLYNSSGITLDNNDDDAGAGNGNFRINTTSLDRGAYYLEVRGFAGSSYGNYSLGVAGTASGTSGPPVADPPLVTINFIQAGDGGTDVQLGATLTSGAYDGTPEYAWTVDGGTLDNASSATPTLTRPTVSADTTYNAGLTVTVKGTGTNARSGTSASVTANRDYTVRPAGGSGGADDHGNSATEATAITLSGTTAGELEAEGDEDWFWFNLNSRTRVVARTTGTTDVVGYLYDSGGNSIMRDDDRGPRDNFLIARELGAGDYFIRVSGWYSLGTDTYETGAYTLHVGPPPANSAPQVATSRLPAAQTATAGGAARLYRIEDAFSDDDGEYLWLAPSSDNETVATVALEGPTLAVYPRSAGEASITMTARDPKGGSVSGSFTLTVSAATTSDPTTTFNAAGDELTLSFSDQFTANETRAYQAFVRQKSPRGGWNKRCVTATNQNTSTVTQNLSIPLSMDGITEPGAVYETQYRHIGSSCNGTPQNNLWSRVAEATAPGTPSFDIDVVWVGTPAAAHRTAVEQAVRQWEQILTIGLPDVDFSDNPRTCGGVLNDVVDDLRLFVRVQSIDGPRGTLASAGTCHSRGTSGLPISGYVNLDADDFQSLSADAMRVIAAHEIGHGLGFSNGYFQRMSLMRKPSLPPHSGIVFDAPDTHFAGEGAIAAFELAGGASYTDAKVPIENIMGAGSGDSHWRESVLDDELMTPRHDGDGDALSAITIQAMADMGYHVDLSQAESYTLPSARSSISFGDAIRGGDAQGDSSGQAHEDSDEEPDEGWCEVGDDGVIIDDNDDNHEIVLTPSAVRMSPINLQ